MPKFPIFVIKIEETMAKIVLISCVKQKVETPEPIAAKDLYTSSLFTKAYAYALKLNPDRIFILSAKYGLLRPTDKIAYYNETLNDKKASEIKIWSQRVREQLMIEGVDLANDEIYVMAGTKYHKYLISDKCANVTYVYKNRRIGEILQFLSL
jgi:cytoplasmic iron level regulating protein YaaA (DUF328/UPF0246 family)